MSFKCKHLFDFFSLSQYNFGAEERKKIFPKIKEDFETPLIESTYCGKVKSIFFKTIRAQLINHKTIFKQVLFFLNWKQYWVNSEHRFTGSRDLQVWNGEMKLG